MQIARTKFDNLQACADDAGIIAAAAMDQRGSLERALAKLGVDVTPTVMSAFKEVVTEALSPHATAMLLDPVYGLEASRLRTEGTGLLLAYEKSGYDNEVPGRLPEVLERYSATRLGEAEANAVKILLYYNPFEDETINDIKHAFVERVGAECEAVGLPFFLEPVTYHQTMSEREFAKHKPEYVQAAMKEFSKVRYGVDVLKVEFPFLANYIEGIGDAEPVYTRDEAMQHAIATAEIATKPFIYLSAGVDMPLFVESLRLVGEAGVPYSGVLCGRATWKGGIPAFAEGGTEGLREWMANEGAANIDTLNETVHRYAQPWWNVYGGRDELDVVEP